LYRLTVQWKAYYCAFGGHIALPVGNRRNSRGHGLAYLDRSLAYGSDFWRMFAAVYFY